MRSPLMLAACLLVLTACGGDPAPAPATTAAPATEPAPPAPPAEDLSQVSGEDLRKRAEAALREQRIYAPAGNNAIEYYLALRDQAPGDAGVETALAELQPYAIIASEQAMARNEFPEASRLLTLMERADPGAPALPRLRSQLESAQKAAEAAELLAAEQAAAAEAAAAQAAAAAAAAPPAAATPAAPAPTPPPAETRPPPAAVAAPPAAPAAEPVAAAPPPPTAANAPLPRLLSEPAPRYPPMALRRKQEGSVSVAFTIQPDGSVAGARVASSTPAGVFDEAALQAAARWRFEATGRTVSTTRTLNFTLSEDAKRR